MKISLNHQIIAFLFLTTAVTACKTEPLNFEEEVRQVYQNKKGFIYLKVPPVLLSIAMKSSDDNEMLDFFGNARQVGIIVLGEGFPDPDNPELLKNLEEMLNRYLYQDVISISEIDRFISLKIKEGDGRIVEVVTLISQSGSPVVIITMSGEIDVHSVVNMVADLDFDRIMKIQGMRRR